MKTLTYAMRNKCIKVVFMLIMGETVSISRSAYLPSKFVKLK